MRIKPITAWGLLISTLLIAGGIAVSCSNPDQRPMDTIFPAFPQPLAKSPVGLIISDPVFRQKQPDPLILARYEAAALTPMTTNDLWNYFANANSRIDLVGTRITNPDFVSRLASLSLKGVQINIVCEQGYFTDPESAPYISQLSQSGNITIKTDDDGVARQVHSRYAIIDDHIVLASSGDFLDNTFNTSVNNVLVFNVPRTYVNGSGPAGVKTLTDAFLFDFDQMFNMGKFGGDKDRLINHTFNIGVNVEVYFGPNDNLLAEIIDEVNNAQRSISYMINQCTDNTMYSIMRNLADFGYYDYPSNNPNFANPDSNLYLETGVPFPWTGYNSLNHKILIIDIPMNIDQQQNPLLLELLDPVIISGSNNWTPNGLTLNDEQMLILHDLTLGYEIGFIEAEVLNREANGLGAVFGRVKTNRNVPINEAVVSANSLPIPGGVFTGAPQDQDPPMGTSINGVYFMTVPAGFLRNIRLLDLGEANGLYLFPTPIWGDDQPNAGYNLLPGASYQADFYLSPVPTQTGTGSGGGGGGGGGFGG